MSKFNEFKQPRLKSPKNRFQLSTGLNLKNGIQFQVKSTIFDLSHGSNSLNSASGNIYIFLEIFLALNVGVITMVVYVSVYLRMIFNTVIRMTWRRMMENRTCNLGHNLESRYKYLKGLFTNFQVSLYLQSGVFDS